MASLLENQIRQLIGAGFKGRLLVGTLRREVRTGVDANGDPTYGTPLTFACEGIVDTFSAFYMSQMGIPATDVRILLIGALVGTMPQKDDKIKFRNDWYQVRALLAVDPALASYTLQAFKIAAPS